VYSAWIKAKKDRRWASKHFISHRALLHAASVREQLATLLKKIGIDPTLSCAPEREPFLRCLVSGLFLNVAQKVNTRDSRGGAGGSSGSRVEVADQKRAQMQSNATGMNSAGSVSGNGRFSFSNNTATKLSAPDWSKPTDNAPYCTVRGRQPVHIHPSSVLFSMVNSRKLPEFVVYAELLITSKQYMRTVSIAEGSWLTELYPSHFKPAT